MDYTNYSADDFVMDDDFRKWVTEPEGENARFWNTWVAAHPEKAAEVDVAKAMIMEMDAINPTIKLPEDKSRQIWQAASAAFDAAEPAKQRKSGIIRFLQRNPIWKVAASIVVILGVAMGIQVLLPNN
ncbi:MAG: hypothetical protein H7Y04_12935, partial [Verrucomicrobia bacterium]|nr:hypothetical protein [Cytophagales bacterium]